MIPDKIYINNEAALDLAFNPGEDDSKIEYFRKDSLLEWAKGEKKATEELIKEHPKDDSLWAEMHWYEKLIKHIGSL